MKRSLLLAAAVAVALALAAPAGAGERIDATVAALQTNPVYVDPPTDYRYPFMAPDDGRGKL